MRTIANLNCIIFMSKTSSSNTYWYIILAIMSICVGVLIYIPIRDKQIEQECATAEQHRREYEALNALPQSYSDAYTYLAQKDERDDKPAVYIALRKEEVAGTSFFETSYYRSLKSSALEKVRQKK